MSRPWTVTSDNFWKKWFSSLCEGLLGVEELEMEEL